MNSILQALSGEAMAGIEGPLLGRTRRGAPVPLAPILQPRPWDYLMQPLIDHHNNNVLKGKTTINPDGSVSTIRTMSFTMDDGKTIVIPSIWDGQELNGPEAYKRAMESGVRWPRFDTQEQADALDALLHEHFR